MTLADKRTCGRPVSKRSLVPRHAPRHGAGCPRCAAPSLDQLDQDQAMARPCGAAGPRQPTREPGSGTSRVLPCFGGSNTSPWRRPHPGVSQDQAATAQPALTRLVGIAPPLPNHVDRFAGRTAARLTITVAPRPRSPQPLRHNVAQRLSPLLIKSDHTGTGIALRRRLFGPSA